MRSHHATELIRVGSSNGFAMSLYDESIGFPSSSLGADLSSLKSKTDSLGQTDPEGTSVFQRLSKRALKKKFCVLNAQALIGGRSSRRSIF
eukprot:scaffold4343_cov144-Cylindrotheca_fusiformis.AAC.21